MRLKWYLTQSFTLFYQLLILISLLTAQSYTASTFSGDKNEAEI
jgi:hypothetical protein